MQIDPQRQQAAVSSQEAERAAREADVALRAAAAAARQPSCSPPAPSAKAGARAGADRAADRRGEPRRRCRRRCSSSRCSCATYTITAPTAGIVGDVPVRVGNQVSPQTVLTTIDQNDTLEVNVSVPIERAPALKIGLPMQVLSSDGARDAGRRRPSTSSRRAWTSRRSRCWSRARCATRTAALRSSQFVRARIVWKTGRRAGRAGHRGAADQRPVLRVRRRGRRGGKLVAKQRAIKVGPIAGDNYPVLEGIKPGDRIVVSGAQKLRRRRADRGAAVRPSPPAARLPSPEPLPVFVDTFIRRPILASVCSLVIILAGAIAIPTLPIAQFPELAPPQVHGHRVLHRRQRRDRRDRRSPCRSSRRSTASRGCSTSTSTSGNDGTVADHRHLRRRRATSTSPPSTCRTASRRSKGGCRTR